jgi:hypothetical protein
MQDMGFVLYDSLVKKLKLGSNVTVIPSKKRGYASLYSGAWQGVFDPYEFAVFSAIVYCKPYGFDAGKLETFFRAGADALARALNRLVELGVVVKNSYQVYDSGVAHVGRPRSEYDYTVDFEMLDILADRKKAMKTPPPPTVPPVRVPVDFRQKKRVNKADHSPITQDAPGQQFAATPMPIPMRTRAINRNENIHECHLSHKAVILASDGYEPEHKAKLDMFIYKLARDGNVLAGIDTFCERFNAYLDVCYENEDKWAEINGALTIPPKNEKSINALLRSLREPFSTVRFTEYQERFFALMDAQHRVVDKNAVVFVNQLRDIFNRGDLEKHFNSLAKKSPPSKK